MPQVEEEGVEDVGGEGARVGVASGQHLVPDGGQDLARQPELLQAHGQARRLHAVEQGASRVVVVEGGSGEAVHLGGRGEVEGEGVGEQGRVGGRVRQAMAAAEHVGELVVQGHRRAPQRLRGQPGPPGGQGAHRQVVGCLGEPPQGLPQQGEAAAGGVDGLRRGGDVVEGVDAVSQGVEEALLGEPHRQRAGEGRVVAHHPRTHAGVATGDLGAVPGEAPDVGALGARVGGRHCRNGDRKGQGHRLGQADGAATPMGEDPVRADVPSSGRGGVGHGPGHLGLLGEEGPCVASRQAHGHPLRPLGMPGRGHEEHPLGPPRDQGIDHRRLGIGAEHDEIGAASHHLHGDLLGHQGPYRSAACHVGSLMP